MISDCGVRCGDGVLGGSETCDNGNKPGCSATCKVDPGYYCTNKFGAASLCV